MASPISPISRLPFGSNVGAAVEKYAEFGTADFTVKDYVNRALAGAVSDRSSAIAALKEKDTTSAVAQQELDGFATTVLEEESAKDASGPSPTTSAVSRMPSTLDHPMTSEQLASSLVTNLQSISSEISANIDKVCEDSLRNVPRVLYDLDAVRVEAARIKDLLRKAQQTFDSPAYAATAGSKQQQQQQQAAIAATMAATAPDTGAALANGTVSSPITATPADAPATAFASLLALDTVLSRMLQSLAALQETEHWATLGSEMSSIFASGDLDRAATRLLEAQRSLSLLEQTAGYEERKQLLTDLMNQLEAEVVPKLVEAIDKRDIEGTKKMKGTLARMGRAGELFGRYYFAARKMALVEMWKTWTPAAGTELDLFLVEFYDAVLSMVTKELSWASGLFGDVVGAMHDLLGQVFGSLTPPEESRLADFMTSRGASGFPILVDIYTTAAGFALTMESTLSGFSESWSLPLLQPFLSYQNTFGVLEQRYLLSLLEDSSREYSTGLKPPPFTRDVSTAMESYAELVQRITDSVVPFTFQTADGAAQRCEQFTYGFATKSLLESLDMFFHKVVRDGLGGVLTGVRKAAGMDLPGVSSGPNSPPRQKLTMADGGEWEIFQLGLKILAVCAGLDKRFTDFETGVLKPLFKRTANVLEIKDEDADTESEGPSPVAALTANKPSTGGANKSPINATAPSAAAPTKESYESVPQSALSLLRRSQLNSEELRSLLLSPPSPLVNPPLEQLTRDAHRLVFDASFLPIQNEFAGFAGLPWNASESSPVAGAGGSRRYGMMEMPQFSLNPSPYITRIGEHLLTLPQQMELYQDDEGLCYRPDLLPFLDLLKPTLPGTPRSPRVELAEPSSPVSPNKATGLEDDLLSLPAAALYLTALSLGTQVLFVTSTMNLPGLSEKGARQLSADAGYLANVVSALDVEVLPTLRAIEDMCGCATAEVSKRLEAALGLGCAKDEEEVRRKVVVLRTGPQGR